MDSEDKKTQQGIGVVSDPGEAQEVPEQHPAQPTHPAQSPHPAQPTHSPTAHPPAAHPPAAHPPHAAYPVTDEPSQGHVVPAQPGHYDPGQLQPAGDAQVGAAPASSRNALPSGQSAPPPREEIETLSGRFIWISLWRAFRLQIHTNEVLQSERETLAQDAQHIVDPEQQAFLAWRRSVLLLVAILFVPLTVIRFVEAFDGPEIPVLAQAFVLFPALAEGLFCAIAFDQLKNWTKWKQQRRVLFIAWALYTLAPFLVYLYPYRTAFEGSIQLAREAAQIGNIQLKIKQSTAHLIVGMIFGVQAQLVLAPKVISLMPGLIRASIVSKMLFPGMTAPGWLMLLAAPLYALFAYIMVLLPYQITGHWYFVAGNAGILFAQIFIGMSGRILTVPLEAEEAHRRIQRSWMAYIGIMAVSAGFMILGLHDFISQLDLGIVRIISNVLAIVANVLLLTLVGTDLIVGGMAYFRKRAFPDPERERLLRHSEAKLDRFSS